MSAKSAKRCPQCGSDMNLKKGQYGYFYSCSSYPNCKGIAKLSAEEKTRLADKRTTTPSILYGDGIIPKFTPMPQQRAIIDVLARSKACIRVEALAGCGKSSTSKVALWRYIAVNPNARVLAATQGKRITTEFASGAPPQTRIQTWHSFGRAQVLAYAKTKGYRTIEIDKYKTDHILDKFATFTIHRGEDLTDEEKLENNLARHYRRAVTEAVRLCKSFMFDGSRGELDYLFERFSDLDTSNGADVICYEFVPQVLKIGLEMFYRIDMTDMIYMPAKVDEISVEQFDLIVVDEAQDLNTAQHFLAIKALSEQGRMLFVGDRFQAIMGFTGADTDSMDNFQAMLEEVGFEVVTLPLTVSLRCPQAAGRLARELVPDFEVLPTAIEGSIEIFDWERLLASDILVPGVMVTCRLNAPLVSLAWQLFEQRIPVKIQGIQFAEGLRYLIVKSGATTSAQLAEWITEWGERELDRLSRKKNGGGAQTEAVQDKIACILRLCDETRYVSEIERVIEAVFADIDPESGEQRKFVLLTSIHRGKGLEAETVICIPMHGPHPSAKQEWQVRQEMNLLYVQWTRTKNRLIIVTDPRQPGNPFPSPIRKHITSTSLARAA